VILQQDLVCIKHTLTFWRCSATTYSLGTPNIHSYNPSTMYHYRHIESLLRHFTANLHQKRFYSTITTPAQTLLLRLTVPQLQHTVLLLRHKHYYATADIYHNSGTLHYDSGTLYYHYSVTLYYNQKVLLYLFYSPQMGINVGGDV
jgi:hypothetical protein